MSVIHTVLQFHFLTYLQIPQHDEVIMIRDDKGSESEETDEDEVQHRGASIHDNKLVSY